MTKTLSALSVSVMICICVAGCNNSRKNPPLTHDQQQAQTTLGAQMKTAAQTAQTYKAMDNATLLNKLVEQSSALKEPFNSLAYRELKKRSNVDPAALSALVKQNPNHAGLLPLLLLRSQNHDDYLAIPITLRASVLTDALQNSKYFNTWGLPNVYLEAASQAMFEAAPSTFPALRRMLSNTRPAPLFGSQEAMESDLYHYRVCDYALFFLKKETGDIDFRLPASPAERDAMIKTMLAK